MGFNGISLAFLSGLYLGIPHKKKKKKTIPVTSRREVVVTYPNGSTYLSYGWRLYCFNLSNTMVFSFDMFN